MKDATLAQGFQVINLILEKNAKVSQLHQLLTSGLLSDLLDARLTKRTNRDEFRRILGLPPAHTYSIRVNYDSSVEALVKAGKYDWSDSDITSRHFPSHRKGTADIEIVLVGCERDLGSDDALKVLASQDFRPADVRTLLAFGIKHPNAYREFDVVALGSPWRSPDGDHGVPCLARDLTRKKLHLFRWSDTWNSSCRFAAVRE
jgi:hypothetical protein